MFEVHMLDDPSQERPTNELTGGIQTNKIATICNSKE